MENNGFIKLHRSMTEWEWFDDIPTFNLFTKLLFLVNWKDKKWQGQTIKRGEVITSLDGLKEFTKLSTMQVRTSLKKLQSTGEIKVETTNKYTKITIINYHKYQMNNKQITNKSVSEQQTNNKQKSFYNTDEYYNTDECKNEDNKQITNEQQTNNKQITTTKEDKELKNNNTIYINNNTKSNILIKEKDKEKLKQKEREKENNSKRGREIPPKVEDVRAYCQERNNGIDAQEFCDFYESKGWFVGKNKMKDWKACVRTWENKRKREKGLVGKNGIELKPENERNHKLDKIFKRS